MSTRRNRRQFLKSAMALGTTVSFSAASWSRVYGANSKVRIASVGTGGKGWTDLTDTAASPHADVAALCDIDESENFLGRAAEKFPQAKRYNDWRRLFDRHGDFDAVIVSTPDHMHAPVSLPAMQLGKHVQCQKPLTHTVFEARQMKLAAKKYNVVTQMGNQIQSHEAYRTAVKLVHDGVIGKVKEVHCWLSGTPGWLLVGDRPSGSVPIPGTLHWDDWIGAAPLRPYISKIYHPFNWRAWQDFSNGQLGDFGCHILDPVFMALKLTAPLTIQADAAPMNKEVWCKYSKVTYEFPGTDLTAGKTIRIVWYDGEGQAPSQRLTGIEPKDLPSSGSMLIGENGSLLIPHIALPKLFPAEKFADYKMEIIPSRNHYVSWVDACRGEDKTTSHFDYSGPLTETVLLGTIAARTSGALLTWNADTFELSGSPIAQNLLTKKYREGWEPNWV